MNSTRKTRRGVIGIESAIVLIAFVIVAAALAFVVLNMGFSTTQKSKAAIISSVSEASSSLEVEGKIIGFGYVAQNQLNATIIPIKVGSGGSDVDFDPALVSIKYYSDSRSYDNIYGTNCSLTSAVYNNTATAFDAATTSTCITSNPVTGGTSTAAAPASTKAVLYWTESRGTQNSVLSPGEHAIIGIAYASGDRPKPLDNLKVEVIVPTGSALTVERTVPSITNQIVDLG